MFLNQGNLDQTVLEKVQKLSPIAERNGISLSQLSLAWCLRRPEVSSVIIGASRPSQVEDNAGAAGIVLAESDLTEMKAILS
jgi:aryl-alcohol dehydrogenase-like predicted oxidoreductase